MDLAIRVECYAGHRDQEEPRRFYFGTTAVDVLEILDRWLGPDHRYFKVRGSDGDTYILRHDVVTDQWELTMFERQPRP